MNSAAGTQIGPVAEAKMVQEKADRQEKRSYPAAGALQCPVCEHPKARPHYRLGDRFFATTSELFLLYRCYHCGLLFQNQREIMNKVAGFYPPGYWWYRSGRVSALEQAYREWIVKVDQLSFLKKALADLKEVRLLDIGCGGGTFVKLALQAGYDAYGLEQSPEAAAIGERTVQGRIYWGGLEEVRQRGLKFEAITMFHCLEHLTDPFHFLKMVGSLLARPGNLVLQVPNAASLQARIFRKGWYGLDCPRHVCNFTGDSLLHLLGRCGFRIQRVRHFSLRDNAAALTSSLFPGLDPMSQRVKLLKGKKKVHTLGYRLKEAAYLNLLLLAQPFAWLEALLGRGGTVTVHAIVED